LWGINQYLLHTHGKKMGEVTDPQEKLRVFIKKRVSYGTRGLQNSFDRGKE
jgi:hypothetical protein